MMNSSRLHSKLISLAKPQINPIFIRSHVSIPIYHLPNRCRASASHANNLRLWSARSFSSNDKFADNLFKDTRIDESKEAKQFLHPMDYKEIQKSQDLELHLNIIRQRSGIQDGELAGPAMDLSVYKVLELLDQVDVRERRAMLFSQRQKERQRILEEGDPQSVFMEPAIFEDLIIEVLLDLERCFQDLIVAN